jgi:hypothetical protein
MILFPNNLGTNHKTQFIKNAFINNYTILAILNKTQ